MTEDHILLLNKLYSAALLDDGITAVLSDLACAYPDLPISYQAQCVYQNSLYDCAMFNHGPNAVQNLGSAVSENPFPPLALKTPMSEISVTSEHIRPEDVERTDFFEEFLKPHGAINRAFGIILHREGQDSAFVAANLPKAMKQREEDHIRQLFEFLRPHMQGAFKLLLAVKERELLVEAGSFWLDHIPTSAFVVTPDRKILHMNDRARRLLKGPCQLQVDRSSRITGNSSAVETALETGVGRAHALQLPIGPVSLSIVRTSGCFFFVTPIKFQDQIHPSLKPFLNHSLPLLLTIFDPDDKPLNSKEIIATALGLSESESRLIQEMVNGGTLREIAERLEISYHTARNQLASATSKTGAKSQTEIVRAASQILAKMSEKTLRR